MFDIKLIRENLEAAKARLAAKNCKVDLEKISAKDLESRALQKKLDELHCARAGRDPKAVDRRAHVL